MPKTVRTARLSQAELHRLLDAVDQADRFQLLSKTRVLSLLGGIANTTLGLLVAKHRFPKPLVLGDEDIRNAHVSWHAHEVFAWIEARPRRDKFGQWGEFPYRGPVDEAGKPTPGKRGRGRPRKLASAAPGAEGSEAAPTQINAASTV